MFIAISVPKPDKNKPIPVRYIFEDTAAISIPMDPIP